MTKEEFEKAILAERANGSAIEVGDLCDSSDVLRGFAQEMGDESGPAVKEIDPLLTEREIKLISKGFASGFEVGVQYGLQVALRIARTRLESIQVTPEYLSAFLPSVRLSLNDLDKQLPWLATKDRS